MKLPQFEQAIIPQRKLTEYLLSRTHRDGRNKAVFFASFGFAPEAWEMLADALGGHAAEHDVIVLQQHMTSAAATAVVAAHRAGLVLTTPAGPTLAHRPCACDLRAGGGTVPDRQHRQP